MFVFVVVICHLDKVMVFHLVFSMEGNWRDELILVTTQDPLSQFSVIDEVLSWAPSPLWLEK